MPIAVHHLPPNPPDPPLGFGRDRVRKDVHSNQATADFIVGPLDYTMRATGQRGPMGGL